MRPPLHLLASAMLLALSTSVCWSAPVELIPPTMKDALQPQAAVAPDGRIHVVFGQKSSGALFHAASQDGGKTFTPPVQIATLPKLALGMRRGPRITATNDTVAVSAISFGDGNLHAWTSTDRGAHWQATPPLNEIANSAREGLHAMVGSGEGAVFATWLDLRAGSMELWGARSTDGGATWSRNMRIYQSPDGHICECCHPSAAMGADGAVAVMWRNWLGGSRDMYAVVSKDGGQTFGPAEKLGEGTWKLQGCPMDGGSLVWGKESALLTAWRREKTLFSSSPRQAEKRLTAEGLQPIVFTTKAGPGYLWQEGPHLMIQRPQNSPSVFAKNGAFAAVAMMPDGRPLIVWESATPSARTLLAEILD